MMCCWTGVTIASLAAHAAFVHCAVDCMHGIDTWRASADAGPSSHTVNSHACASFRWKVNHAVQRTVVAARRALVPAGCELTIYLCDDGRRADKRKWARALEGTPGPPVIYITGRTRGAGRTLNGKSENLNHCLRLIYPADRGPEEVPNIPLGEVMCLFDADQTCSRSFFTEMLPYLDSGDNVAVALSPQLMFNVSPDVDIFNHQNVHFWEKMQPGMDALGFISLTGARPRRHAR